jgi:hypothetical protein
MHGSARTRAQSRAGNGTRTPRVDPQNGKRAVTSTAPVNVVRETDVAPIELLVVDDNRAHRELLVSALRAEPWIRFVDGAATGADALARSVEYPPIITLLDVMMDDALDWLRAFVRSRARVIHPAKLNLQLRLAAACKPCEESAELASTHPLANLSCVRGPVEQVRVGVEGD